MLGATTISRCVRPLIFNSLSSSIFTSTMYAWTGNLHSQHWLLPHCYTPSSCSSSKEVIRTSREDKKKRMVHTLSPQPSSCSCESSASLASNSYFQQTSYATDKAAIVNTLTFCAFAFRLSATASAAAFPLEEEGDGEKCIEDCSLVSWYLFQTHSHQHQHQHCNTKSDIERVTHLKWWFDIFLSASTLGKRPHIANRL